MNMQQIGSAQPVLLLQTTVDNGLKRREDFSSERQFIKYLRKQLSDKNGKKPDDKNPKQKTFTYWEMLFILMATSFPVAMIQIGLGYAVFKVVRQIATGQ